MKKLFVVAIAAASVISVGAMAQEATKDVTAGERTQEATKDISAGSIEQRVDALAAIQPGLGTIMIEYGARFINTHFAAQAGNWGLAEYLLHEAVEIQEVGEITRPKHAKELSKFEHTYLGPLAEAIKAEDLSLFNKRYSLALAGCNECHALTRHAFIQVIVPDKPLSPHLNYYAVKELSTE